jgi:hypothetical protein
MLLTLSPQSSAQISRTIATWKARAEPQRSSLVRPVERRALLVLLAAATT